MSRLNLVKRFSVILLLSCCMLVGKVFANPLAEWRLDQFSFSGTPGEVLDSSGFNRHGTARNGLTSRQGIVCQAGDFRGEGFNADPNNTYYQARYYIEVPGDSALSPHVSSVGSAITFSAWFNTRNLSATQTILHKGDGGNSQDYRVYLEGGLLRFQFFNVFGGSATLNLNTTLTANTPYFIAVSARRDLNGQRPDLTVFVELYNSNSDVPIAAGSAILQDFNVANKNTSGTVFIGATKFGEGSITNFFDGIVDEVRIYSGVRTTQQNVTDKNTTRSCPNDPSKLLARDDFSTYGLGSIDGNNGGSGWGGAWRGEANRQQIVDVGNNPLVYQAANGEFIAGSPRALTLFGNSSTAVVRNLPTSYSDDVVYVSMLARFDIASGNNTFAALWFEQTGFSNIPNIGIKTNRGTGAGPEDIFVRTQTANDVYTMPIENGVSYFIVGRLSKTVSGANEPYNRFELWVNPVSLTEKPATANVVSVGNSTVSRFSQIGFRTENLAANDVVTLDQLSLGLRWQDVVVPSNRPTQCLTDNFSDASLRNDWVTARSSGNFTPQIVNGRLQMTQAVANQSTSVTYQRLFPAASNLVIVEFDYLAYGGSGADGVAVVLSDANITPQPGAFGGPLGYGFKPGIPGFAGGWLGVGLDEFGNFSTEGGPNGPGRRQQSVAVRGSGEGTTGYRYLRGTCNNGATNPAGGCLTPRVDGNQTNPHRYRITIDSRAAGTALVSVARDHGTGFIDLIAPFNALTQPGQAAVPENFFLSLTGSTGGSTNIHELDNVSICALRSAPVGQQIDHFEFDYSSSPLTCKAETFTVRACANASCSELVTSPVTARLSPATLTNGGWVGGNVINFSGGSTQVSLQSRSQTSVTVGVSSSVPSTRPLSQPLCRRGNSALSTQNCAVPFARSGFVFSIPDGIAGQAAQNITVSAVRENDQTQQCVPEFSNVTRTVNFWSSYIDPNATGRPVSWPVQVNNVDVAGSSAQATALPLTFNAQGQATMSVNYADAGRVELNARYTGSAANGNTGLELLGAASFTKRPAGLCIRAATACNAANAGCPVFAVAGDNFPLSISAHSWGNGNTNYCDNPLTPNFTRTAIPLGHQLVAPAGGVLGTLGQTQYTHTRQSQATTVVQQRVSESGIFQFTSPAFTYLSMTDPVPAATSAPIGRFVPASFQLSGVQMQSSSQCSTNLYLREPLRLSYRLTALNRQGNITRNYAGAYAKASPVLQVANTQPLQNLSGRLVYQNSSAGWVNGEANYSTAEQAGEPQLWVNRQSSGAADGPFLNTVFALQVVDGESPAVAFIQAPDFSITTPSCAGSSCNSKQVANYSLRYGRLQLENAFGPELSPLALTVNAAFWDGSRFTANTQDNCTLINPSALQQRTGSVNPAISGATLALQAGKSSPLALLLAAPGTSAQLTYQYNAPPWLTYSWDGSADYTQPPQNEVIFGRYRGNPRLIFWREQ